MTNGISKRTVNSCGVVIVRLVNSEYKYLMLRLRDHWDFPKGRAEPGEDKLQTALREVKEETTITPDELNFKWGYVNTQTEKYGKGKIATYFIAETTREQISLPINPEIGKAEHEEYRWVSFNQGLALARERIKNVIKWANDIVTEPIVK